MDTRLLPTDTYQPTCFDITITYSCGHSNSITEAEIRTQLNGQYFVYRSCYTLIVGYDTKRRKLLEKMDNITDKIYFKLNDVAEPQIVETLYLGPLLLLNVTDQILFRKSQRAQICLLVTCKFLNT